MGQTETQQTMGIYVLNLSRRAYGRLRWAGIETVGQLTAMRDDDLLAIRNLGPVLLAEIREKLAAYLIDHPLPEQFHSPTPSLPEPLSPLVDPELLSRATRISLNNISIARLVLPISLHNRLRYRGIESVGELAQQPAHVFSQDSLIIGQLNHYLSWLVEQNEVTWADEVAGRGINPLHLLRFTEAASDTTDIDDQSEPQSTTEIKVLDLSARAYNCLRRTGIHSVEHLAVMSDNGLLAIRNLGVNTLAEIREKLAAYLASHKSPDQLQPSELPLPELSPLLVDPELLPRAVRTPLDNISVARLALPDRLYNRLRSQGIESVGDLARRSPDAYDQDSMIVKQLDCYLTWLVEQDEAAWADEVASRGISPLHRVFLTNTTLESLMNELLADLSKRQQQVIRWRYGLDDETLTLHEVGERLNLTRERVRQLEANALRILQRPVGCQHTLPLKKLLDNLLQNAGGIMDETQVEEALRHELTVGDVSPIGVARLIFKLYDDFKSVRGEQAWGCASFPLDREPAVSRELVKVLEVAHVSLPFGEVISRFKTTRFYQDHRDELDNAFIAACLRIHLRIVVDDKEMCWLAKWTRGKLSEMMLALQQIGHPAHFSIITERVNVLLPPGQQVSERNVRVYLDRNSDIFIHLGRGRYWLRGHLESGVSALPQADFGDLFGAELAHWQAEMDRRQGNSKFDTQAEVDIIRSAGLDFFRD